MRQKFGPETRPEFRPALLALRHSKGGEPQAKTPKAQKWQPQPHDDKRLKTFPGTKKHAAVHYGKSTVYLDRGNKLWRIKPEPGSKSLLNRSFKGSDPKEVWKKIVVEVQRMNRT